jgi:hypothetical protein
MGVSSFTFYKIHLTKRCMHFLILPQKISRYYTEKLAAALVSPLLLKFTLSSHLYTDISRTKVRCYNARSNMKLRQLVQK